MMSSLKAILADDSPLSQVDDAEYAQELKARKAARQKSGRTPAENPIAKYAGANAGDVEARERAATKWKQQRDRRRATAQAEAKRQQATNEEAFRNAKARARQSWANSSSGSGSRAGAGSSSGRRGGLGADKLAKYYKVLNIEPGASMAEIKSSYRKLMRKYHPDRHVNAPKKQKAATELSMQVTEAYNALEKHLNDS